MMTEAVYPVVLHQDPRYFRRGTAAPGRAWQAGGQVFRTSHGFGSHAVSIFSEIAGRSTAVAIFDRLLSG